MTLHHPNIFSESNRSSFNNTSSPYNIRAILYQDSDRCQLLKEVLKEEEISFNEINNEKDFFDDFDYSQANVFMIYDDIKISESERMINLLKNHQNLMVILVCENYDIKNYTFITDDYIDEIFYLSRDKRDIKTELKVFKKHFQQRGLYQSSEKLLRHKMRQHLLIDELLKRTLGGYDLKNLYDIIVQLLIEILFIDYCEILQYESDSNQLILKSFFERGFAKTQQADPRLQIDSLAKRTLSSLGIVKVDDFNIDMSNNIPPYLKNYDILSCISLIIPGENEPFGIMRVYAKKQYYFTEDDAAFLQSVANLLAVLIDRKQNECELRKNEKVVRSILETSLEGIVTINEVGLIQSFNKSAEIIFGYKADEIIGKEVNVLFPLSYRNQLDRLLNKREELPLSEDYSMTGIMALNKNGNNFPLEMDVTKVDLEDVSFYTLFLRDISERRQLEKEILEISEKEHLSIGQELHDGLGQMLTAAGLMIENLSKRLKSKSIPEADKVDEIIDVIKEADQYARNLSHGLFPANLSTKGLSGSLNALAENAQRISGISCVFEQNSYPVIEDNTVALHLYRIAQEALNNAIKYSRASKIKIKLERVKHDIKLSVIDNGIGFLDDVKDNPGLGIKIMNYRAKIIGGLFKIDRTHELTRIICIIPGVG